MRHAIITKIKSGKFKGQFKIKLVADNGRPLGREIYTQKHNAVEVIEEYFPSFDIMDEEWLVKKAKRNESDVYLEEFIPKVEY